MEKKLKFGIAIFILAGIFVVDFTGCASKPKAKGPADLYGLVIDEKNQPVSDFVISCKKNPDGWKTTMTNQNGMFVFFDAGLGNYSFRGEKNGFARMESKDHIFSDRSKIFCFQVMSIDQTLDQIEKLAQNEDYDTGLKLLKQIKYDKKSPSAKVISFYKKQLVIKKAEARRQDYEEKKQRAEAEKIEKALAKRQKAEEKRQKSEKKGVTENEAK